MRPRLRPPPATPLAAVALLGFAWWVTGLEGFSREATVAVVGAGAAAMAAGRARRGVAGRRAPATTRPGSVLPWGVLAASLAGWQVAAWVQHPRHEHPTLSSLVNVALDPRPMRTVAFAAWLVAAAWLASR